jgi:hypothetical protein
VNERAEKLTVELAKILIAAMESNFPGWQHAFIRFEASDNHYGSKGSYVTSKGVFLLDPFAQKGLFQNINSLGYELWNSLTNNKNKNKNKKFCVFLLSVNSSFDFKFDYEWKDTNKWQISKIGGGTGIPTGIQL